MEEEIQKLKKELEHGRVCTKCNIFKTSDNFYVIKSKGTLKERCKDCIKEHGKIYRNNYKEKIKERSKSYVKKNSDKIKKRMSEYQKANKHKRKEYYEKNREKLIALNKSSYLKYRDDNLEKRKEWYKNNKEHHAKKREEYADKNKDRLREARRIWENNKIKTDPNYKIRLNVSSRIRRELTGKIPKSKSVIDIIGCSIDDLRIHIESQFKEGMSWSNHGTDGWHIDHKIPVSWFNLSNEHCLKLAFSYKNMQPLWGSENLEKKNLYHHKVVF